MPKFTLLDACLPVAGTPGVVHHIVIREIESPKIFINDKEGYWRV